MERTKLPAALNRDLPRPGDAPAPRRLLSRPFAALASLRLAVVLLALFAACLAGATLLESRYGGRVAQELVYRTWWFALLLALLAVNVLGAALKKYPWKRHQAGFLITHAGLLALVFGGLLTLLCGVEGQMILVDTPDPAIQARLGLTNQGRTIYLTDAHRVEVYRLRRVADPKDPELHGLIRAVDRGQEVPADLQGYLDKEWALSFRPGPFTWYPDEHLQEHLPWPLRLLHTLAAPWPGYAHDLDGRATLTVINFYPHAEYAPHAGQQFVPRNVRHGAEAAGGLEPALRCSLTGSGGVQEFWVGLSRGAARVLLGRDLYLVRYRPDTRPVEFTLTLERARRVKDPGTERSAWFQSDVTVTSPQDGRAEPRAHNIYMNHPLEEGLYKVYQSNYRALIDPQTHEPIQDGRRPVSLSGLTVAHDPGLWLKYAGSLTVVLGIATMFYMRAYFFRPRGQRAQAPH
jgi:hypothetical protein